MADEQSKTERKTAPIRRRRSRASDADAEVNPPGEPSQRRAAPGWERRSKEMPGRQGTMKTAPWAPRSESDEDTYRPRTQSAPSPTPPLVEQDDDDEDFDDEDEDFPHPGRPPGHHVD